MRITKQRGFGTVCLVEYWWDGGGTFLISQHWTSIDRDGPPKCSSETEGISNAFFVDE